jgi:hypothetical protein
LKSKKEVSPPYFTTAIIKETFVFLLLQLKSKKQASCAFNKSSTSKKTTPFLVCTIELQKTLAGETASVRGKL